MSRVVEVALIQQDNSSDRAANMDKTEANIRMAAKRGAQIVCLQELFNTLYFCQQVDESLFELAESVPGPTTERMCGLAAALQIVLLVPLFERRAAGIYHNSMAVIDADGSLMGTYRKMHIPDDPGFYEKYYFTPGEQGYQVYKTKYAKIGPLICWDQWYPEAARLTALKGAEMLVYPTAIGTLPNEGEHIGREFHDAWRTIQRSHAIANGCFVASVNRTGIEHALRFWGGSFVSGPFGQMLAEAGDEEEILMAACDLDLIEKQRRAWPFMRDRRIDSYGDIKKRYLEGS